MLDHSWQARLDHPASETHAPTRSETLPLTTSKARPSMVGRLVHKRRARLDHSRRARFGQSRRARLDHHSQEARLLTASDPSQLPGRSVAYSGCA
eukprot:1149958-Pleurochrysis_carterae.AAC.1